MFPLNKVEILCLKWKAGTLLKVPAKNLFKTPDRDSSLLKKVNSSPKRFPWSITIFQPALCSFEPIMMVYGSNERY